jgi:hypothetical protein
VVDIGIIDWSVNATARGRRVELHRLVRQAPRLMVVFLLAWWRFSWLLAQSFPRSMITEHILSIVLPCRLRRTCDHAGSPARCRRHQKYRLFFPPPHFSCPSDVSHVDETQPAMQFVEPSLIPSPISATTSDRRDLPAARRPDDVLTPIAPARIARDSIKDRLKGLLLSCCWKSGPSVCSWRSTIFFVFWEFTDRCIINGIWGGAERVRCRSFPSRWRGVC